MKGAGFKTLLLIITVCTLFTCIDPYTPKLGNHESHLVVDAFITDEYISNTVTLSRTKESADDVAEKVSGATIMIKDDLGNSTTLSEKTEGVYKTDSLSFRGETGRSYTLYIKTAAGDEYESESCLMYPVSDIDTISFSQDQKIVNNVLQDGIRIYVNSKGESGEYFRWTYEEWWKISVPVPQQYNFVNDSTYTPFTPLRKYCWGHNKPTEIVIGSSETDFSQPLIFVDSDESPRLLVQYCIAVRQLSISKAEYEFWNEMSQINNAGGDVFDRQPFQIIGNIHNIKNEDEYVLGYFQVSGAKIKRRYITYSEVKELDLPHFSYYCNLTKATTDGEKFLTFKEVYDYYISLGYIFVMPEYWAGKLVDLLFVLPVCGDCTAFGSLSKPDFWVDLEYYY
jgi:hypothetical protein